MRFLRKVVPVLLVASLFSTAAVFPASAETPAAHTPTFACDGGACQIVGNATGLLGLVQAGANLALAQLPFKTTIDSGHQATLEVTKDLTLSLPVGKLTLTNVTLQVGVDETGKIAQLNGSADMPFPTFGLLDDARVVTPARANVGLDLGKNLPDTGLGLDPERSYLFITADTAMDVAGRTAGSAEEFALSFVPGQRATLIIDTVEPVAWLDGQVTLSLGDQLAFLGGLLDNTPISGNISDALPLRERTQFGLSGKFSKNLAESRLTVSGGYVLDPGILPAQIGVDAQLVSLLGELTLSRDGVLVNAVLESAIEPDRIFDGSIHVETFIALDPAAAPSYAQLDANVKSPVVKLEAAASAKAGAGKYELSGELDTPLAGPTLQGNLAGKLPDIAGAVSPVVNQAAGAVGSAAARAADAARSAASTVGLAAGRSAATLGDYARTGVGLAGDAIHAGKAKLSRVAPAAAGR